MSLGGYGYSSTLQNACSYAWTHGVLLVAAAGNDGLDMDIYPHYPASFSTVIAVSGTDSSDGLYVYTNYSSVIEVSAPGVSIYSTYPGGYATMTGTSMSTPHVAGVAALALSQNPSLTNSLLRSLLHVSVDDLGAPGWDEYYGYGRINAYKAVTTEPPMPYHFILKPYIDELWLSFNPDHTVNGYDTVPDSPCYPAPILGVYGASKIILWIDYKTEEGCYELAMVIIDKPGLSGKMYRTNDGMEVIGPTDVWLEPVVTEGAGGAAAATVEGASEVKPDMVGFYLRPYIDEEWFAGFDLGIPGLTGICGYADVPGYPGYPAPHLGIKAGSKLVFADDYKPGGYELRLNIITLGPLTGISYATVDGIAVDGPMDVWLERI